MQCMSEKGLSFAYNFTLFSLKNIYHIYFSKQMNRLTYPYILNFGLYVPFIPSFTVNLFLKYEMKVKLLFMITFIILAHTV